jgi:DNA-binding response OmpR family regulator
MNGKILIYSNNDSYMAFLSELIIGKGYNTILSDDEFDMFQKLEEEQIKFIITSYNLTNMDGETFLKTVRNKIPDLPIIFVSNVRDEEIIATMMSYPKCDFMVKPVVPEELIARIKILTGEEPLKNEQPDQLLHKDIELDKKSKIVKKQENEIALTPTEFRLLEYLMTNKNIVLSREKILNEIWETNQDITDRIVDVYIGYLREKIDPEGLSIQTVQGFGYKFTD